MTESKEFEDFAKAVVKSEQSDDEFPFQNDGNFLQNYLNSQKNEKKTSVANSCIKKVKNEEILPIQVKKQLPALKKSRFTSMLNQMKRTKSSASSSTLKKLQSSDASKQLESPSTANISSSSNFDDAFETGQPVVKVKVEPKSEQGMPQSRPRKRKSRWGEKVDPAEVAPPGIASVVNMPISTPILPGTLGVSNAYRPPGLVGCSELSNDQRKQLEEQREMQAMYNMIMASRNAQQAVAEATQQASQKRNKHAYDSDEEIDDDLGTWEHQKRRNEMEKTKQLAEKLTNESEGKHFIGDFLPPDQLERFMETFKALKEGRTPDFSDYKDFKLKCDNIGFKMLEKMGWSEGEGLGSGKQGITAPINQGKKSIDGRGVGVSNPDALQRNDDEFSAYRKRMMLAYRFRPNPLNNPRRPYY